MQRLTRMAPTLLPLFFLTTTAAIGLMLSEVLP